MPRELRLTICAPYCILYYSNNINFLSYNLSIMIIKYLSGLEQKNFVTRTFMRNFIDKKYFVFIFYY